jgi:hypothetical protein
MQQVFTGVGRVAFSWGRIKEVYPQWWGSRADSATNDTAAIQSAVDSLSAGVVFFPAGYVRQYGDSH